MEATGGEFLNCQSSPRWKGGHGGAERERERERMRISHYSLETLFWGVVLGLALRALHLLDGALPLEPCPPACFALVIFWAGSH
jgi:hypothetical protein